MEQLLNDRIAQLEISLFKIRKILTEVNKEIASKKLVPNELQKAQLEHIANQGVKTLKDIEMLNDQLR